MITVMTYKELEITFGHQTGLVYVTWVENQRRRTASVHISHNWDGEAIGLVDVKGVPNQFDNMTCR